VVKKRKKQNPISKNINIIKQNRNNHNQQLLTLSQENNSCINATLRLLRLRTIHGLNLRERIYDLLKELNKYKNRKLISALPAVSTHGETQWLSPFINWENEFTTSFE
jgi:hypothetical protein